MDSKNLNLKILIPGSIKTNHLETALLYYEY